jgi:acid phosphatase (class A)
MRTLAVMFGAAAVLAVSGAQAQSPLPPPGYLAPEQIPDGARILPAPPKAGEPRYVDDRAIYAATRRLEGSPRWVLATNDVKYDPASLYADFACALGVTLTPATAPKLTTLILRIRADSSRTVNATKGVFKDPRPYLAEGGDICVEKTEDLAKSPNYPSGHSSYIWATGLALAELAPDRATAILHRARAFGESRAVCGVHTASAVEAGRTISAAMISVEHTVPDFRGDMEAARVELTLARARGPAPDAAACRTQEALLKTPW